MTLIYVIQVLRATVYRGIFILKVSFSPYSSVYTLSAYRYHTAIHTGQGNIDGTIFSYADTKFSHETRSV